MAWIPQVKVSGEDGWHGNALVFATEEEAFCYARDLFNRWTLTTAYRAVEQVDGVVNYQWDFDACKAIML